MYFLILSPLAFIEVDFLKHHFSGFQVLAQDFGQNSNFLIWPTTHTKLLETGMNCAPFC